MIQLYARLARDEKMNNLQRPQKDMEKEIAQLESFIKSDIDARELKRAIAVRKHSQVLFTMKSAGY